MDEILDGFVRTAWTQCWQVTLLIVTVGALHWCLARSRPHLASVLWLLVIVKCLTPPIWSSPSGVFCWLQPVNEYFDVDSPSNAVTIAAALRESEEIVVRIPPIDTAVAESISPQPLPQALAVEHTTFSWEGTLIVALVITWFGGLLACIALMMRRWRKCWREIRAGQVETPPELTELLIELQQRLGIRRRARLLITESAVGPAVVGLWRPTIVLPLAIVTSKQRTDIEPLLAHELMHLRRGDLWVAMLQLLVQCLWWFHPLVRWANRWLTHETERSCDEEVIGRLGCSAASYARSLLNVLELKQQLNPIPTFPGVRPVDVTKQRLERIMKLGQGCRRSTPWWCWGVLIGLAVITLPGAALLVRAKDPPPSKTQPSRQLNLIAAIGDEVPASEATAEMTTKTYEAYDLLEKLEAEIVDNADEAALYLESVLQSVLSANADHGKEPKFGWHEGRLVVRTTATGHHTVEEQLALYRQSGFKQYVFEVRVLRAPAHLQQAVKADWCAIQPKPDADLGRFEIAMDGEEGSSSAVESTINRQSPVISALFDEKQMRTFMTAAQADKDMNFVCAPKITTFNGQSVRIESLERRPFVVACTKVTKTAWQPEIRVIDVGWKMRLRARGTKDGKINVDFARAESEITKVDIRPVSETTNVQVPQVAVNRLQTQVELEAEQTYVLGGLESLDENPAHQWVLITVRKIDEAALRAEESGSAKKEPAAKRKPISAPDNQGVQPEKVTKLYSVADLTLSIAHAREMVNSNAPYEGAVRVTLRDDARCEVQPAKVPELDSKSLIDLITTTIEPDSWQGVGGEGTIEFVPQQTCLLISQYERIHERIDELLGQLRRLQQLTVVLNLKQVWIRTADWEEFTSDVKNLPTTIHIDQFHGYSSLNADQATTLRKLDARKDIGPTPTLAYNGQAVVVEAAADSAGKLPTDRLQTFRLTPVIAADLSGVNLSFSPKSNPTIKTTVANQSGAALLNDSTTLVLDLDRTNWQARNGQLLHPEAAKAADDNAQKPEYRRLLFVTTEIFASQGNVAKRAKKVHAAQ